MLFILVTLLVFQFSMPGNEVREAQAQNMAAMLLTLLVSKWLTSIVERFPTPENMAIMSVTSDVFRCSIPTNSEILEVGCTSLLILAELWNQLRQDTGRAASNEASKITFVMRSL